MANGNRITLVRIVASAIISLVTITWAGLLLQSSCVIPTAFWTVAIVAVGGVTGADVVSAVVAIRSRAQ